MAPVVDALLYTIALEKRFLMVYWVKHLFLDWEFAEVSWHIKVKSAIFNKVSYSAKQYF